MVFEPEPDLCRCGAIGVTMDAALRTLCIEHVTDAVRAKIIADYRDSRMHRWSKDKIKAVADAAKDDGRLVLI